MQSDCLHEVNEKPCHELKTIISLVLIQRKGRQGDQESGIKKRFCNHPNVVSQVLLSAQSLSSWACFLCTPHPPPLPLPQCRPSSPLTWNINNYPFIHIIFLQPMFYMVTKVNYHRDDTVSFVCLHFFDGFSWCRGQCQLALLCLIVLVCDVARPGLSFWPLSVLLKQQY